MNKFTLIALACATTSVLADDLYVAPEGKDTHLGTRSQPFASLLRARDAIRAARAAGATGGWTVHLKAGDYLLHSPLVLEPCDSGSAEAPVVFVGEGPATRIIGGLPVTGWKESGEGVWSADLPKTVDGTPAYFESLFVNGRRAVRARHPNAGFFTPHALKQTLCTNASPRAEYARAALTGRDDDLAPLAGLPQAELRYAQVVVHHNWDTTRRILLGYDAATSTLLTQGGKWKPWNPWRTNSLYYVENVRAAFDAPGEWLYDGCAGKVLYRPLKGERIDSLLWGRTEAFAPLPGLPSLVVFKGSPDTGSFVSHITFRNLSFCVSDSPRRADQVERTFIDPAVLGDPAKPGPTQFEPMQAAARTEAAIMADGAHHIALLDCEVTHTGEYGIWFRAGCVSNRVERCALTDLGAGGIRIGDPGGKGASIGSNAVATALNSYSTAFNTVDNCIIKGGGRFHASATAVWIGHSPDNAITHNEISDHFYTGVSVGWVWGYKGSVAQRNTVAFNRIRKIGQGALGDMGGVYTLGTSFGTRVCNNVISDVDSFTYGGWGLYTDEGSEGIVMENNLVYDTKDSSFHQHYGRDNVIRNNILCYSRECQIAFSRLEPHRSAVVEGNIVFWESGPTFSPTRYKNTAKANVEWKRNLWWRCDSAPDFEGKSFAEWQALGRDVDGLVADPLFRAPEKHDFRLKKGSPAAKIGFTPFDVSQAGVYGSRTWRRRAQQ
jgi:hypothetical protein